MRSISHIIIFALGSMIVSGSSYAAGDTNAATMKIKVYKFAVSTSKACTSPITVFENSAGVQKDMLTNPTFGSGTLKSGTYPCVMIEASKIINTSGTTACTTAFDDVICSNSQTSKLIDGTSVTCSGGASNDQRVTLFITTASAGTSGNRALLPPDSEADSTAGIKLTSPFVVTTSVAGTFKVNATNFINSSGCTTSAPTFTFQ